MSLVTTVVIAVARVATGRLACSVQLPALAIRRVRNPLAIVSLEKALRRRLVGKAEESITKRLSN